jgi:hypothetical protein
MFPDAFSMAKTSKKDGVQLCQNSTKHFPFSSFLA